MSFSILKNQLLDYSKIEFVNTTYNYTEIKNGEKLLVFVFTKEMRNYYNNLWHCVRVCNIFLYFL